MFMKSTLFFAFLLLPFLLLSQKPIPEDYGYTRIPFQFQGEDVNIIILSAGMKHDTIKKPLFLFVQGSLPRPLFFYDKNGNQYGAPIPFKPLPFFKDYHFIVIGKPGVPLIAKYEDIEQTQFNYKDPKTGDFTRTYCKNNHLDYYVKRNKAVLKYLSKQKWVDKDKIVVAGHSEGVQVALKMAIDKAKMTHLILLNAGLEGRIMSIITHERSCLLYTSDAADE